MTAREQLIEWLKQNGDAVFRYTPLGNAHLYPMLCALLDALEAEARVVWMVECYPPGKHPERAGPFFTEEDARRQKHNWDMALKFVQGSATILRYTVDGKCEVVK